MRRHLPVALTLVALVAVISEGGQPSPSQQEPVRYGPESQDPQSRTMHMAELLHRLGVQSTITEDHAAFAELEQAIMAEEGFRSRPYRDSLDVETIGFGTNIQQGITRHEAQYLMRGRLVAHIRGLEKAWPRYAELPHHAQAALADMSYQLGVGGVLMFRDMLACLEQRPPDLECAHDAALDSLWADETPDRAARVTDRLLRAP